MADQKPTLKERIDSDTGLKSKRNALVWVSLVLLTVTFTGATIKEANTFILKIEFLQGEALSILIALTILFLWIRYYSYAYKYHEKLSELWMRDFKSDPFILGYCNYSSEPYGLMVDDAPNELRDGHYHADECSWHMEYQSKWFFIKSFYYSKIEHAVGDVTEDHYVNVLSKFGLFKYIKVFMTEWKHRIKGDFIHRENLDIRAPYFIAFAALASLLYQDDLSKVLNWILT